MSKAVFIRNNYLTMTDKHISELLSITMGEVNWIRRKHRLFKPCGNRTVKPESKEELARIRLENTCIEMQTLIEFCEKTDNMDLKRIAKARLKTLSGIPINNPFADRTVGK